MTIGRVKPANWAVDEKLTSAQMNSLDINVAKAVDRSSPGDTVSGPLTMSTAGRIIPSVQIGANTNTTYTVGSFNELRVTSAVTANRNYTLSATGAATNDVIRIWCEPSFTFEIAVKDQASATIFTLGNLSTSDGTWVECVYIGGWRVKTAPLPKWRSQAFTFADSGSAWTPGAGVTRCIVAIIGGGGGGGGGAGGITTGDFGDGGAGGGGAGAIGYTRSVTVTPATPYTVTVGAAGAAGVGSAVDGGAGGAGGAGGTSSFGTLLFAVGGASGAGGGAPSGGSGDGTDGPAGASQPGGGTAGTGSGAGGAAGWAGGHGGNTGVGAVGTAGVLGAGGGGGSGGNGDAVPASATAGSNGGAGGAGLVVVYWFG
jgi:hypothetical protein